MADRKVTLVGPDGNPTEGIEVPVASAKEPWSEYELADGTVLRMKQIVADIVRIPGQYDAEGNPMYVIKATSAVVVSRSPPELRKPKA